MGSQEFLTLVKLILRPTIIGRECWGYSKRRSLTEEERRLIVNGVIRNGIAKASDKRQLWVGTTRRWARRLGLQVPRRSRFQEKPAILQEAIRKGTGVTCRANNIDPTTLRYWRLKLGL